MNYKYTAIGADGKKIKGSVIAESAEGASVLIRERALEPIEIKETSEKSQAASIWQMEILEPEVHKITLKKKKLLAISQKMSIMMRAGVTLATAFDVIVESEKDRRAKKVLREVGKELYLGENLSEAMSHFAAFPSIMVSIISSGEANGRLDWAFKKITEMYERELDLQGKVSGAMGYPAFLIVLVVALIVIMNTVIIPRFTGIFDSFNIDLPLITRAVMALSGFIKSYGLYILLIVAVLVTAFVVAMKKNESLRIAVNRIVIKIPVIGTLMRESTTASFCRVVSTLIESGVDIIESLSISLNVIGNAYIKDCIKNIVSEVKLGATLYDALANASFFDPLFISMLRIGEKSSMIGETMSKLADMYEEQSAQSAKRLTTLLEPMMTLIIGLVVGVVVISIIVPMFKMYSAI